MDLDAGSGVPDPPGEPRLGGRQITAVHLKLGALSGVVKVGLVSSSDLACENTVLAGSTWVIEDVPIVVH
jgi:hydrogenase nickel incorporation protein HypA/HybF